MVTTTKVFTDAERQAIINKAAAEIITFFSTNMSYSEMVGLIAEGAIKVWGDDIDENHYDGDNRAHEAIWAGKTAYDLLRPFAALAGQTECLYYYKNGTFEDAQ